MLFSKKATGFCVFPWRQTVAEPVAPPRPFRRRVPPFRSRSARVARILRVGQISRRSGYADFSPGLFAKRPPARAAAHRTDPPPRGSAPYCIRIPGAAARRADLTAPWRPPRNHYSSTGQPLPRPAPGSWWGDALCCRPTLRPLHSAPSCGIRRPARSGGGCRLFAPAPPVWHESCASGRFPAAAAMQIFRQAFLQKGRQPARQRTVPIPPRAAAHRIASVSPAPQRAVPISPRRGARPATIIPAPDNLCLARRPDRGGGTRYVVAPRSGLCILRHPAASAAPSARSACRLPLGQFNSG